jgi:hypothetical protein
VGVPQMEFLREHFLIRAWPVSINLDELKFDTNYDLVWVGSVVTHLAESATRHLLEKLMNACNPGGLVAFSFHGASLVGKRDADLYLPHDNGGWQQVAPQIEQTGYGYVDYVGQVGYGCSFCTHEWIVALAREMSAKLILLSERAWDDHHDVAVFQKRS